MNLAATTLPKLLTLAELGDYLSWPADLSEGARKDRVRRLDLPFYRIAGRWLVALDDLEDLVHRSRRSTAGLPK